MIASSAITSAIGNVLSQHAWQLNEVWIEFPVVLISIAATRGRKTQQWSDGGAACRQQSETECIVKAEINQKSILDFDALLDLKQKYSLLLEYLKHHGSAVIIDTDQRINLLGELQHRMASLDFVEPWSKIIYLLIG